MTHSLEKNKQERTLFKDKVVTMESEKATIQDIEGKLLSQPAKEETLRRQKLGADEAT
jgi:hypothetical protein